MTRTPAGAARIRGRVRHWAGAGESRPQALPIFLLLATLSFVIGLSLSRERTERLRAVMVALGGAITGALASALLLLADAVPAQRLGLAGQLFFFGGPGVIAFLVFALLDRRSLFHNSVRSNRVKTLTQMA